MRLRELTEKNLDALAEMCNIAAGHAAGSLAQLIKNIPIRLNVPRVNVVSLNQVPDLVGGPELLVGAVRLTIEGPIQGSFVTIFDEESCRSLIGSLNQKKPEEVDFQNPMAVSTLAELGNILSSSFLGVFSQLTQERLLPSIPYTAFDMAGAVLDEILIELGKYGDEALFIEILMAADQKEFFGQLFLIPDPQTLENLKL
jgi:chemotaxis protein CheC